MMQVMDIVSDRWGFVTPAELAELAARLPDTLTLTRCGGFRFLSQARDTALLLSMVDAGGDYVRDVCVLSGRADGTWRVVGMPEIECLTADVKAWAPAGGQAESLRDCLLRSGEDVAWHPPGHGRRVYQAFDPAAAGELGR